MDLSHVGRNDPCPCGSGKKFKKCHLGREAEIKAERLNIDPFDAAKLIVALPECRHARAAEMAAALELTSKAGKPLSVKLKDLAGYLQLGLYGQEADPGALGGVLINPQRTRLLDPEGVYLALSPQADDSTVLHQLAHIVDLVKGSGLEPAKSAEAARASDLPGELLEHPQEYGETLLELSKRFSVELDAEDEIVAILARRQLLLPASLIVGAQREPLVAAAEKALRYLRDNQDEVNARIKGRRGYMGGGAPQGKAGREA
jgi:hypothetical protein